MDTDFGFQYDQAELIAIVINLAGGCDRLRNFVHIIAADSKPDSRDSKKQGE